MKLQIIVGATRAGRVTDRLAKWVALEAKTLPDVEVEIVDLLDYELPLFNESISPQYNPERAPAPVVKSLLDKLSEADGYVIATPEYNRSYSGVLKNALDYVDFQLAKKPVSLVAHGSTGGAQAVSHLRGVIPALQAVSMPNAVYVVGRIGDLVDEAGNLDETLKANPYGPQAALKTTLSELAWYAQALSAARRS